ncbi:MAG: hypothetical protein L0H96_05700 [Humibacillus sp.]|nr:hypothetical protein [Humibacillus sp.]MDN5776384.1 hypothetical protein [Humibacillus sp.]
MPIVFIHGVAVRDDDPVLARRVAPLGDVPWATIEAHLRQHVAPVVSDDPEGVPIMRIYWGDLGARFAWGGQSLVSRPSNPEGLERVADAAEQAAEAAAEVTPTIVADAGRPTLRERRVRGVRGAVTAIRRPLEDVVPVFIGDVMTYIATRGTAGAPGPIIQRTLDGLEVAAFAAESRCEPLVVLTHSMGGQIVYDIVTHFLPLMPEHRALRIDYWCAAASQVGFFEELGLFLESRPDRGHDPASLTPLPSPDHLGGWWNVWDHADLLSFRAAGIFEGVDDSAFFAAGSLTTDHNKYLVQPEFYRQFAERLAVSLGRPGRGTAT